LDGLLMGMAAGYVIQANPPWLNRMALTPTRRMLGGLLLVAAALLMSFDWLDTSYLLSSSVIWVVSLTSAGLLLIGVSSEGKGSPPVKQWKVASWVATISYPLYLVHYLMLGPAQAVAQASSQDMHVQQFVFWLVYLVTSFALAWLLHVAVEKPFLLFRESRKTGPEPAKAASM
jgi:peptidoglycan/LPS O-acetylase OafA/YrhL